MCTVQGPSPQVLQKTIPNPVHRNPLHLFPYSCARLLETRNLDADTKYGHDPNTCTKAVKTIIKRKAHTVKKIIIKMKVLDNKEIHACA